MSDSLGARMHCLSAVFCALATLCPSFGLAQTPEQAVPITAEPEHLADGFSVMFRDTAVTVQLLGGAATRSAISDGRTQPRH
jgi:hypothetical protein